MMGPSSHAAKKMTIQVISSRSSESRNPASVSQTPICPNKTPYRMSLRNANTAMGTAITHLALAQLQPQIVTSSVPLAQHLVDASITIQMMVPREGKKPQNINNVPHPSSRYVKMLQTQVMKACQMPMAMA